MVGAMASLAALSVVLAAVVQVEGNTSCPAPELVALRLGGLLAPDAVTDHPDRARLQTEGDELVVVLERADGELLGTRRLPLQSGCDDLAAAAAVSLATWESDVHPEFAPGLAARAVMPALGKGALPPPALAPVPWVVDAGASLGLGGSIDGDGYGGGPAVAGSGTIGAWVTPPAARTSLRVELEGQSQRQVSLQDGHASWRRWTVGLGLERSFFAVTSGAPPFETAGGGRLRWFALARVAALSVHGQGFAVNRSDNSFDAGVTLGVRTVAWRRGRWSSWLDLSGSAWPLRRDVAVGGASGTSAPLPAFEAFLRVGGGTASSW
jgi:hypothetical protein